MPTSIPLSWSEFAERLWGLPWQSAFLLLSMAGIITSLIMIRVDHRFEVKRLRGMTRHTLAILTTGLVSVFLLLAGLLAIELRGDQLPAWTTFGIPGASGATMATIIWWNLRNRPSFTVSRFTEAVVIPLIAPIIPLFGGSLPHVWRLIRDLSV